MKADLDTPIADISFGASFIREAKLRKQLDTRIKNTLQRNGIMSLGLLVACKATDLPMGLGVISIEVIKATLRTMGHRLGGGS